MKEKDDNSHKDDKKDKKKKKEGSSPDKKLVKELTKKIGKELDKRMDVVLKQVRKETRKALREVLAEVRNEPETGTVRSTREALLENQDEDLSAGRNFGSEEVQVEMEPDELHMGGELEVVTVGEEDTEDPTSQGRRSDKPTSPAKEKTPQKQPGAEKKSPENQNNNSSGTKRRTPSPPKKGTAEREIGTDTGTGSEISPKA